MARLPIPGQDEGIWGDVLNQYLLSSHMSDGSLRGSAISDGLPDGSVASAKLASSAVTNAKIADGTIAESKLDSAVQTKLNAGSGDPAMGGDLSGTASDAQLVAGAVDTTTLADGAITNAKVSASAAIAKTKLAPLNITNADVDASAAIAQSKVADLTTDLSNKSDVGHGHAIADVTNLQTSLDAKADTGHGHAIADVTNLQTSLDAKANDSAVVHLAGAETVTGAKDFTGGLTVNATDVVVDTDTRLSDERTPTDDSVTTAKLANSSVTSAKLAATAAPGSGQVLSWDGADLSWVDAPTGTGYLLGEGIAKVTVGTTAPSSPGIGDVWIST